MAIIGQLLTICIVYFYFKYPLPLTECLFIIAASAWLNIILIFSLVSHRILKHFEAGLQLGFDIIQLALLIYFTGGMTNPFAILLIAPTTIAAATLRRDIVIYLILLSFAAIVILHFYHLPLPWPTEFHLPNMYKNGLEFGVAIGILFTAIYSHKVAQEEMRLAEALIATQSILSKEQRLSALGGLAAAAAHELGTPLATIQLVSKELSRDVKDETLKEDITLIYDQSIRCRDILRNLTSHQVETDPTIEQLPIGQLLEEAVAKHNTNTNKAIVFDIEPKKQNDDLIVRRIPEITYGIGNYIENAISYANELVIIGCEWDNKFVKITISDDGKGFDPDILPRIGEPYVSTRGQGTIDAQKREGLGLGFFIAKTLIERTGGKVEFGNRQSPKTGAIISIIWSRDNLEYKAK